MLAICTFASCTSNTPTATNTPEVTLTPTASPNPSGSGILSPATANPSSSSAATDSPSETEILIFAEDDDTEAIFHIGMTREEVKQALIDNQMQLKPSIYGTSEEFKLMSDGGFTTTDGIHVMYDNVTDLLCQVGIFPVSETELYSPYATQKGLKIW